MSNQYFKINILTAALALTFAYSSFTQAASGSISLDSNAVRNAQAPPVIQLAMMDEMKMGGMPPKDPAKMKGEMPMNDAMPSTDASSSMQAPMASPSSMDMMGRMRSAMPMQKSMNNMTPAGQLPGFPGASHLYHIGATDFFLDHPQHISLSTAQQTSLNRVKEKTLLDRANTERRIEDAEQEMWTLTAADSPDVTKIEAKVQAIEKLRSSERMAFIRAIGEAGKILTSDQQAALLGTKPATTPQPAAGNKSAPMPNKSMPDTPAPDKPMTPMNDM